MKKIKIWWILVLVWCIIIFYQSSKPADLSSVESMGITKFINEFFKNFFGKSGFQLPDFFTRKSGHFIEYFILGGLVFKALNIRFNLKKSCLFATVLSAAYAATDEFHQYFIPGRAARVTDVLLDAAGAVLGIVVITLFQRNKVIGASARRH